MARRGVLIKLTLMLLCLGALPLVPEVPHPLTFALLALALVAAVPLFLRFARTACRRSVVPVRPRVHRAVPRGAWQLLLPVAPGAAGTVRSRAPSGTVAAHS